MPRLVILGSSNTDLVAVCERFPQPGETLAGRDFRQHGGGKGANQAVAAARAGAQVTFIGACGADDYGARARAALEAEGIDLRHFHTLPDQASGVAIILIEATTGENLITLASGANLHLPLEAIAAAEPDIAACDLVLAQLETPLEGVLALAALAQKYGKPFVLNPAPAQALPDALIAQVLALTPNETEATQLTGEPNPVLAALNLRQRGCRQVVITLGPKGYVSLDDKGLRHVSAPEVPVVDTVGAGDCFSAWLAVGLAEGLDLTTAATRALHAASQSVTQRGAQEGMPWREKMMNDE